MSAVRLFGGSAVALVGPDGAGKTTVARALCEAVPRARYLYMGTATASANYTLPSSRLILLLKRIRGRRSGLSDADHRALLPAAKRRNAATAAMVGSLRLLSLVNRLAEEWYRQIVLLTFKARGLTVVCDRHFQFEHLPNSRSFHAGHKFFSDRAHLWFLRHCYPKPDIVFFLDAAPEVLYRRKREWTLEHLERHRNGIVEEGRAHSRFVRIDAEAPLQAVVDEVRSRLTRESRPGAPATFLAGRRSVSSGNSGQDPER